jgi:ankyrin repeat protein
MILRIAMMACNTALLTTCKEIRGMTTMYDRILMAIGENDLDPKNALMKAISAGAEIEIVQFILDHTSFDDSSLTDPLIEACVHGRYQVVELLLNAGADVSARNDTCLIVACLQGHYHVVELLLNAGADVHAHYDMSLRIACSNGHYNVVELLLNAGADVHADDDRAFEIATEEGFTSIGELLRDAADARASA